MVDTLLVHEKFDSAYNCLKKVNAKKIDRVEDKVYYILLYSQTCCSLYKDLPDTVLDFCIDYYSKTKDDFRLMKSYYYKAMLLSDHNEKEKSVFLLKKAERLVTKFNSALWHFNVCQCLAEANKREGLLDKAMYYEKQAIQYALIQNNIGDICNAYNWASIIADQKNDSVAAAYYTSKLLKYVKKAPLRVKGIVYTNIAANYFDKKEYKLARKYYEISLNYPPNDVSYHALAGISAVENKFAEADSLWNLALQTKDLELKEEIYLIRSDVAKQRGLYKESALFAAKLQAVRDTIKMNNKTEAVMAIQADFDKQQIEDDKQRKVGWGIVFIVVLLITGCGAGWYYHHKVKGMKVKATKKDMQMADTADQLQRMTDACEESQKSVKQLEGQLNVIKRQQELNRALGYQRYQEIVEGGNTSVWHKPDFIAFAEYYRAAHCDEMAQMEQQYDALTHEQTTYQVLCLMGYGQDQIQYILCKTPQAMRTLKSRLNGRRKVGV